METLSSSTAGPTDSMVRFGIRRWERRDSAAQNSDHDPVGPGLEPFRIAELRQLAPDGHERLLGRIVGSVRVAQNSIRDPVQLSPDAAGQELIRFPVPATRALDD